MSFLFELSQIHLEVWIWFLVSFNQAPREPEPAESSSEESVSPSSISVRLRVSDSLSQCRA